VRPGAASPFLPRIAVMLGERRSHPFALLRADARHRDQKLRRHKGRGLSLAHLLLEQAWRDPTASTCGDTRPLRAAASVETCASAVPEERYRSPDRSARPLSSFDSGGRATPGTFAAPYTDHAAVGPARIRDFARDLPAPSLPPSWLPHRFLGAKGVKKAGHWLHEPKT
jgi:hypothetical protein